MPVSNRFILEQGPVLSALGRTALTVLVNKARGRRPDPEAAPPTTPGPVLRERVSPRSAELVRAYIRHVGGSPSAYRGVLPPHLFPQWSFPLSGRVLEGLPYPLDRVLNGGCKIEVNAPLPADEPLEVSAQLVDVDANPRRAILTQRVTTSTASAPEAVVATLTAIVPLGGGDSKSGKKKEKARVPEGAREVARWRLRVSDGLDFARLTGDFNPIHWIPAYARAAGFRNTILHGFSTYARAWEGLEREAFKGQRALATFDASFTRPLVLPRQVGLFVLDDAAYVGDAPCGPAYMTATFTLA